MKRSVRTEWPVGGVNVSVEVIDYTPRLVTEVLAPDVEPREGPVP